MIKELDSWTRARRQEASSEHAKKSEQQETEAENVREGRKKEMSQKQESVLRASRVDVSTSSTEADLKAVEDSLKEPLKSLMADLEEYKESPDSIVLAIKMKSALALFANKAISNNLYYVGEDNFLKPFKVGDMIISVIPGSNEDKFNIEGISSRETVQVKAKEMFLSGHKVLIEFIGSEKGTVESITIEPDNSIKIEFGDNSTKSLEETDRISFIEDVNAKLKKVEDDFIKEEEIKEEEKVAA